MSITVINVNGMKILIETCIDSQKFDLDCNRRILSFYYECISFFHYYLYNSKTFWTNCIILHGRGYDSPLNSYSFSLKKNNKMAFHRVVIGIIAFID
jgi:hypothetical protein